VLLSAVLGLIFLISGGWEDENYSSLLISLAKDLEILINSRMSNQPRWAALGVQGVLRVSDK